MTATSGDPTNTLTRTIRLWSPGDPVLAALGRPTDAVADLPGLALLERGHDLAPALQVTGDRHRVSLVPTPGDDPQWDLIAADGASPSARIELRPRPRADGCALDIVALPVDGRLDRPLAELATAALYQLVLNIEATAVEAGASSDAAPPAADARDVPADEPATGVPWSALAGALVAVAAIVSIRWSIKRRRGRTGGSS